MPALVAAALAGVGNRPAWLAAILADRYARPLSVIVMAGVAVLVAATIAALLGASLAPRLTPNAALFLLALALLLEGGGALLPTRAPDRLEGWRIGVFATSLAGSFVLVFADGTQFVILALAARSGLPLAAAIGATVGALAVLSPAALLGEAAWLRLPLRRARVAVGLVFLIAGGVLALSAARLI